MADHPHYRLLKDLKKANDESARNATAAGNDSYLEERFAEFSIDVESVLEITEEIALGELPRFLRDLKIDVQRLSRDDLLNIVSEQQVGLVFGLLLGYEFALSRPDLP